MRSAVLVFSMSLVTSLAHAQVDEAEQADRLEHWLAHQASRGEEARLISGVIAVSLGAIEIPFESVILAIQPQHPSDATTLVFGSVGVTFGLLDFAYGIYKLAFPSVQEERLARWHALRARGPVTVRDLGRFEGEIRGELASIQEGRRMWLAIGIGLVVAGGLGAGLTAGLADSDLGRDVGYATAGTAALSGICLAIFPWLDDGSDREWLEIAAGHGPEVTRLSPWIGPYGGGLTLSGTL